MALLQCNFFSEALELSTSMTVILPQETTHQIGMTGRTRGAEPPVLYLWCGTEDGLVDGNRAFIETAQQQGIELTSELSPGDHDWRYWDTKIQDVLRWMLDS